MSDEQQEVIVRLKKKEAEALLDADEYATELKPIAEDKVADALKRLEEMSAPQ